MQPYSQETMDQVLKLIPHENHRKLATMLMENVSIDEIKTHGFDDIQIEQYQSLIENVLGKDIGEEQVISNQEATKPEEAQVENKVDDNDNSTKEDEKTDETTEEDEIVDTEKGEVIPA